MTHFTKLAILSIFLILLKSRAQDTENLQGFLCSAQSRQGDVCPDIYAPVCAFRFDVTCQNSACFYITYPNSCEACHDPNVQGYVDGECDSLITLDEEPFQETPESESDVIVGETQCTAESRKGEFCPAIYQPVCGYRPDSVCTNSSCEYMTYSSPCDACHDPQVVSFSKGECSNPLSQDTQDTNTSEESPRSLLQSESAVEVKVQITKCSAESRNGGVCPAIEDPVCGYIPDFICVGLNCHYVTYSNSCEACHDIDVVGYIKGECEAYNNLSLIFKDL